MTTYTPPTPLTQFAHFDPRSRVLLGVGGWAIFSAGDGGTVLVKEGAVMPGDAAGVMALPGDAPGVMAFQLQVPKGGDG